MLSGLCTTVSLVLCPSLDAAASLIGAYGSKQGVGNCSDDTFIIRGLRKAATSGLNP
jgi:hypothetical protein